VGRQFGKYSICTIVSFNLFLKLGLLCRTTVVQLVQALRYKQEGRGLVVDGVIGVFY
jgi:hypothetical protein